MTIDRAVVDVQYRGRRTPGLLYVALSRVRHLTHLLTYTDFTFKDIKPRPSELVARRIADNSRRES